MVDTKLYEVTVFGDSINKFDMELDPNDVVVIKRFLDKLNLKVVEGSLANYDYPTIEFNEKEK